MSQISVRSATSNITILQYAIECPFCHTNIIPKYLFYDDNCVFAKCPNEACNRHFVLSSNGQNCFVRVNPNSKPVNKEFSEIINTISQSFVSIYNEAYHAEQIGLNQICGVGFRKALEFLIKDYLISNETDENRIDSIKNMFLSNCIKDHVQNENIKNVANRAVWLGNDETHYVRIWKDKDVNNLKQLIELTVRWIENEVETEQVLQEMNK